MLETMWSIMLFWSQFRNCLFCLLFYRVCGQLSSGSGDGQSLAPYLITCSVEVSLAVSGSVSNNFSLEEQCYIDFQTEVF